MAIFTITIETANGSDGIRRLRWILKALWRRHGLRAVKVEEIAERARQVERVDTSK